MYSDIKKWINKTGQDFFKRIGISSGQKILDFGCGWGSNTIAISRIVSKNGCVYAFEKDKDSINKLLDFADKETVKNIRVIQAEYKTTIPISDDELDCVLLYDIIHDHYFDKYKRQLLFKEMERILKKKGLLSIFPHHIIKNEFKEIREEIIDAGFIYKNKISDTIIHDSKMITDTIYNFIKK